MSAAAPTGYPGNPSLPKEVRDKILSTFRHTLNLYKEGKTDDCVIGCDFILKMDPRFAPARQLMEKAKNPAAARRRRRRSRRSSRRRRPGRSAWPRSRPTSSWSRAAESLNARDFDAAIAAAEQVLEALPGNRDAQAILDKARQRKDSGPQIEVARQRAMMALDANRTRRGAGRARADALDRSGPPVDRRCSKRGSRASAQPPPRVGESHESGPLAGDRATRRASGELGADARSSGVHGRPRRSEPRLAFARRIVREPRRRSPARLRRRATRPRDPSRSRSSRASSRRPPTLEAGSPPDMWGPAPGDEPDAPTADGYPAAFSMGAAARSAAPEPPSPAAGDRRAAQPAETTPRAAATASRPSRSGRAFF